MGAIPTEIRRRVVEDCKEGMSYRNAAEKWRISAAMVCKIMKRFRETGEVTPPPHPRGRKQKISDYREAVETFLEENKTATLADVREKLDVKVSVVTVWRHLKKWGFSHKKNDLRKRTQQAGRRGKTRGVEGGEKPCESAK